MPVHEGILERQPLSAPVHAVLLPKMPQSPAAGQELPLASPSTPGCPSFSCHGAQGHGSREGNPRELLGDGIYTPSAQFVLSLVPHQGTDSLAQPKDKFLARGQPGPLQFIMELPWNHFVVTLSVPNEFTIISAFSVNPSGSNNDFQFIQKGCYFPWQKMMT